MQNLLIIYIIAILNKNLLKELNWNNVLIILCENVTYDVTYNERVCYIVEQEINNSFNSYDGTRRKS